MYVNEQDLNQKTRTIISNRELMTLNEPYLELLQHSADSDDEAEETLSLCDLSIYSDCVDSSSNHEEAQIQGSSSSSSTSSADLDFFEFSCCGDDGLSNFDTSSQPEADIVFCGKLIARREPLVANETPIPLIAKHERVSKKVSLFRWRSAKSSSNSGGMGDSSRREGCAKPSSISRSKSSPKELRYDSRRCTEESDLSGQRASLLRSTTKSRNRSPLFGLARVPVEMEMSEIRSRQRRRGMPGTVLRSLDGAGGEVAVVGRRWGKGLWGGLVRAFGCGGFDPNAAVKATFSYVSPVRRRG